MINSDCQIPRGSKASQQIIQREAIGELYISLTHGLFVSVMLSFITVRDHTYSDA